MWTNLLKKKNFANFIQELMKEKKTKHRLNVIILFLKWIRFSSNSIKCNQLKQFYLKFNMKNNHFRSLTPLDTEFGQNAREKKHSKLKSKRKLINCRLYLLLLSLNEMTNFQIYTTIKCVFVSKCVTGNWYIVVCRRFIFKRLTSVKKK